VLCCPVQGGGEWHVPSVVRNSLPPSLYAHTCQPIDFVGLKGKRIAVLGGGASAFDNAQHALECGAGEVHVFVRRDSLPRINPIRQMEYTGGLGTLLLVNCKY
jgi:cation diffusion facilitator CzcD-associated flavoprotein CzcO